MARIAADMLGHFRLAVWVAFGADPVDLIER
jgi:hypothetical protein